MNEDVVLKMLELMEQQDLENLTLRGMLLELDGTLDNKKIDLVVSEALADPGLRRGMAQRYAALRQALRAHSSLESALEELLKSRSPQDMD
jgi:hypothetical protein